jgi:hypothetical protein
MEPVLEWRSIHVFGHMTDHQSIRPSKIGNWLAKRARGQDMPVSKRVAAIEQDKIQIALERQMLETVIQHKNVNSPVRQGGTAGSRPILAHPDSTRQVFGYHHRLVAKKVCHLYVIIRLLDKPGGARTPSISPGQNHGAKP